MKHEWDWLMATGFVLAAVGLWVSDGSSVPAWDALMLIGLALMAWGAIWQTVARRRVKRSREDSRQPQP